MRTTLTLEPDVAAAIERLRRKRDRSLKEVVNDLLRKGLEQEEAPPPLERYRTSGASLGSCLVGSLDDVAETLAVAEGEDFR
jgi:hypothetical protein